MGIKLILIAAITLVISTNSLASTVLLDMSTDPVIDEGWGLINNDGSHSVSAGILSITAPTFHEIKAPSSIWQDTVSNSAGWVIETRMRRVASSTGTTSDSKSPSFVGTPYTGTPGIWINDGVNFTKVGFESNALILSNAFSGSYSVNTSIYHTYRFEGMGDSLDVFVDGSIALSFSSAGFSGATFALLFGDLNSLPDGNSLSQWDYFSVTTNEQSSVVPIPAALWLFSSGMLALARFAKRRKAI